MIYIQSNSDRTFPHHFDCACALYGAMEIGSDYRLTTYDEVVSGKFDNLIKNSLFIGSVEFMQAVFNRVGLTDVRVPENSNRPCEIITLAEAKERAKNGEKLFIKPVQIKLFTGLVLDGMIYSCLQGLPPETKVMAYEPFPVKIISEWRIYVHKHTLLDSRHYSGDVTVSPEYGYIGRLIEYNKAIDFPCAYTIDIAIFPSTVNLVVEYNDMWAIGNYGVPNDLYLLALKDRYFEIMKTNK